MNLKDLTPEHLYCGIGACPAIFETDQGTYLVIGRKISGKLPKEAVERVGTDEEVVEIPKELLLRVISRS